MADVLSQGEIDALLSALSTGEMNAEELKKEETQKKVRVYDFKRALRFSKEQIRSLTRIHENFSRLLTSFFSAQLRTFVQIHVASVDQLPYEEFISSIPKMTILNVFEPTPLNGRILMEVNPNIAYAMLDRLMGGKGASVNKIDNLTEIETKLMSALFQRTLDSFTEAWSSVVEIDPILDEIEVNPQFLQMVPPNETVVVISLSTSIAETSGMITICLPHMVLEEILPKLSNHYWLQENKKLRSPNEQKQLEKQVRDTPLLVQAELGRSEMTIQEFLHLGEGDVIELNQSIHDPLVLSVGGESKYLAQPGKQKNKLAVQVTHVLEEADE
ncbi:flagellar motor switch protein FliM [Alkalicoccobacillus murimartini]|uniref:Flagellar motor switch protein FliM n=1 Tax=Alkalicoccobacillus murimartini TaxID=171685 RepID=A0ABT9YER4_9BACI|nr:flagellar motor switch protein FliM [Alkalicoccobacillus murimartini]MDQ0206335.1 flagellar motor switch protein FliM [Alkalicoccobacillus murimartini]